MEMESGDYSLIRRRRADRWEKGLREWESEQGSNLIAVFGQYLPGVLIEEADRNSCAVKKERETNAKVHRLTSRNLHKLKQRNRCVRSHECREYFAVFKRSSNWENEREKKATKRHVIRLFFISWRHSRLSSLRLFISLNERKGKKTSFFPSSFLSFSAVQPTPTLSNQSYRWRWSPVAWSEDQLFVKFGRKFWSEVDFAFLFYFYAVEWISMRRPHRFDARQRKDVTTSVKQRPSS